MRALLLLLCLATPLLAQDDELQRLRAEVERLKQENTRLQKELDQAKGGLPAPPPKKESPVKAPPPAKDAAPGSIEAKLEATQAAASFDSTPIAEVGGFLQDLAGVPIVTEGEVEGLTISLRAPRVSLRILLDLIAGNTKDTAEDVVDLEWKVVDGKVVIRRRPE